jgi:hypothetical protein
MKFFFLLAFFSLAASSIGQTKPTPKPAIKGKVPVVTASLGGMQSGTYGVGAGKILIDSALVLKDEKGRTYAISRCSFMYKRKMVHVDESSGEKVVKTSWEYLAKELRNNEQLDDFWRSTIKEDLKSGEELIFGNIMADTKQGYMVPVKTLKIIIK